jgi:hypothetical protein
MKIFLKNTLTGLIPLYDSDLEEKKKLKLNEVYRADIVRPRNIGFHKKYFALLNMTFQNQELFDCPENMRKEIIKHAGYYKEYRTIKGEIEYRSKSISFAKMSQDDFEKLYSSSLTVILKYILTGSKREEIEQEIINFM